MMLPGFFQRAPLTKPGRMQPPSTAFMQGREVRVLVMVVIGLAATAIISSMFMSQGRRNKPAPVPRYQEEMLRPMDLPVLNGAPPLPDGPAVAAKTDHATFLMQEQDALRLRDLDPLTLAWSRLQLTADRTAKPIAQRVPAKDLLLGQLRAGTAMTLQGMIIESREEQVGDETWTRLVMRLTGEEAQYVQGLMPPGAATIEAGREHILVGRYAGTALLPTERGGQQRLPVLAVRTAYPSDDHMVLEDLGVAGTIWRPDPDIYQGIDDSGTILETRPYYYTLGQVLLDRSTPGVYDKAGNANLSCKDLHFNAAANRGRCFTVEGKVYRAFEDSLAGLDRPYGVSRVFRIWIGRYEWHVKEAHVYEVVVVVDRDAVLPQPGDLLSATGRFLKVQGYRVGIDFLADLHNQTNRQSDRAYFKLLVCPGFTIQPKPKPLDWFWYQVGFGIIAMSFLIWMVMLINRESNVDRSLHEPIQKLRANRRKPGRQPAPAADASAPVVDAPPPAPAPVPDAPPPSTVPPPDAPPPPP